ncbi:MAG TPA: hypothetical protein VGL67_00735, partial [Casimicrobiaceae bacterium]
VAIARMRWPADARPISAIGWWASWIEGLRYARQLAPVRVLLGVVADRIDRRRGLLMTQSLMLAQAVVLAVLVAFGWIKT